MGHVIPLHGDPHEATQQLIPWYVTGTLAPAERLLVDQHLATCAECSADLASEVRLRGALSSPAATPAPLPGQWEALRDRALAAPGIAAPRKQRFFASPRRVAVAVAAQMLILAVSIGVYDLASRPARGDYRALADADAGNGAAMPGNLPGNLIVIFRPDISEQAIRAALRSVGARLVDGPTAADAYVLAVAPARRDDALKHLRNSPDIVLAQPVDPSGSAP